MKKFYTASVSRKAGLCLFCFLCCFKLSATNVSGSQSGTWNVGGTPYILSGTVTVPAGQTLSIDPGVEVQFPVGSQLDVQGTLVAQGTNVDSINFTGGAFSSFTQRGPITFENTGNNSILQFVNINQLGYNGNLDNTAAIIVNSSTCTISNCTIQNIRGTAISIANSISPVISNNVFTANANMDVILGLDNVRLPKGNNALKVGLVASTMAVNDTLTSNNVYYRLLASQTVPLSKTLVINPGVEVQFTNGASTVSQLDVQGTLKAQGDVANYVNFTGGGFSSFSQRGPVTFENTSSGSILQYVNISQLGYNGNTDYLAAIIVNSTSCTISNCNIQNIQGSAISIANSITPVISNNVFTANANMDVILGLDNVRLPKGNNALKVGLLASTMAVNDTLTSNNVYYRLLASQTVPLSKTLVINPGVEVQFTNGASNISQLDVQGTLKAQGDVANYINFTGGGFSSFSQRGPITFENTSSSSILQYVNISQLGYNGNTDYLAAIIVNSTSCTISNCNIQNIQGTAISIANSVTPVISNNVFTANANMDVILGLDNVRLPKGNNPLKVGLLASSMGLNDTLTANNIYYRLLASQTVPLSKTLVINPGVEVQFTNGNNTISQVDVQGTLKAQGDVSNYINFTGGGFSSFSQRGPITFESTSSSSILQYVNISQLGYNGNTDYLAAIIVNSTSCTISNCNIQNIQGTGIEIANSITPVVSNNVFTSNANMDAILGLDNIRLLKGNNPLKVGLLPSSMGLNDTLTNNNVYYRLLANQTIPESKILVINPGVEVQFTNGNNTISQVDVQGTLKAQGNADSYINFTGGGFSSFSQRGPITFETTSINSLLQFVNISQLGYNNSNGTTPIIIIKSSSCQVINSIIQMNKGVAVQVLNSASPTFLQSCFYTNASGAVLSTSGSPKFQNCNFVGNISGIVNQSATDIVDASSCWWGNASGPFQRTTNPAGVGDSVSTGVVYTNFAAQLFDCSLPVVPLTLLNFNASLSGNYVNCSWQTATESNTSHFIVERSTDGISFNEIGKVSAAGNSSITKSYQLADKNPNNGINYYRLKMVDIDGKYTYSKVLRINIRSKISFVIAPNPVKENLFIHVQRDQAEKVILQITDMQGKILHQENQQLQPGTTRLSFNTSVLSKGMYLVLIKGQKSEAKTFVKE